MTPDINYGSKTNIVGRVLKSGTTQGVAGVNVAVDQIRYGLSAWYRVALVRTDAAGYVRLQQPPVYDTQYRIRFGGTGAFAASRSPNRLTRVHRIVTATSSAADIYPDQGFSVTGGVTPAGQGQAVHLDRFDGTSINSVASSTVTDGKYMFNYTPNRGGVSKYRVRTPAGGGRSESVSPTFQVRVYSKHFLAGDRPVSGSFTYNDVVAQVNGATYGRSLVSRGLAATNGRYSVGYDLARSAKRFNSIVGLRDDSASDARVIFILTADGKEIARSPGIGLGAHHVFDLDVTGVLRLDLAYQPADTESQNPYYPTFGDPIYFTP